LAKALWAVAAATISLACAIFAAGVYWANVTNDIAIYKKKIDDSAAAIDILKQQNAILRSEINGQFAQLNDIKNGPPPFKNTSGPNGAGNSADQPPGRCQPDEVVVGIQPLAAGGGLSMQCGKIPRLRLN
jgi:hypothetical protein